MTDPDRAKHAEVRLGIDVLAASGFAQLRGLRFALLANDASRTRSGQRTVSVLAKAPGAQLVALFSPEHGLGADREGNVQSGRDAETGLPIHSLYGARRRPSDNMLSGLDAVVVDLQDVGVRFYTYATTLGYLMEAAAQRKLKVFVLDRPNPIGAAGVRGPVLDPALRSFTGYFPMPLQHGMTLGELATMYNSEMKIGADLTVVRMENYERQVLVRSDRIDLGQPLAQSALAGGYGALSRRSSHRRHECECGTGHAGSLRTRRRALDRRPCACPAYAAPRTCWRALRARRLHANCGSFCWRALPRRAHRAHRQSGVMRRGWASSCLPPCTASIPASFKVRAMLALLGSRATLAAIEAGETTAAIEKLWQPGIRAFMGTRARYLLY